MPELTAEQLTDTADILERAGFMMERIADAVIGLATPATAEDLRPLRELAGMCSRQAEILGDVESEPAPEADAAPVWVEIAQRLPAGARAATARVADGFLQAALVPQPNGTERLRVGHARSGLVLAGGRPLGRVPTLGELAGAVAYFYPQPPRPAFALIVTGQAPDNLQDLLPAGLTVEPGPGQAPALLT